MERRLRLLVALALVAAFALPLPAASAAPDDVTAGHGPTPVGVTKLGVKALRVLDAVGPVEGVATYPGRIPTERDVSLLSSLGIEVQPMSNLPLALVRGPVPALLAAVDRGYAFDVYPNEQLEYFDRESSAAINAHRVWDDLGFDGSGVGVAVIDTGVDATHGDLEDRVTHNIKIVGSEYVDSYNNAFSFVIPVDQGPYNNADTSGHGTHVAGIVAADGSSNPDMVGVAPGADIIGYGAGDLLFLFTVLASFEHVLEHHEEWGIRVTNNSWGSSFRHFDPLHPINLATKALHDEGIVTVFAAGNSIEEMQLNPWSMPPWVISVGSTTVSAERSSFSSGGLKYDNSLPIELPEDGHLRFTGDRIGVYNPDVSAPGSNIDSAGTPTGVGVLAPTAPGGTATLSGTSMAAPHVAGLVALLLEANPDLTPDQVKQILQVTTTRMRDDAPFWQSGYGFVDARAAVELATSDALRADPDGVLGELQAVADEAVLAARDHRVIVSDHFWFQPLPVTIGGLDTREFTFEVEERTQAIRATTAFADDLGLVGINLLFEWLLVLRDAAGEVVAESEVSGDVGYAGFEVDFDDLDFDVTYGEWTLEVVGLTAVADGEVFNDNVSVAIAQLEKQDAVRTSLIFQPLDELELYFTGGGATPIPTPEGCDLAAAAVAGGGLTAADVSGEPCEAGFAGFAWNYGLGIPAEFVSDPLEGPTVVGGEAAIVTYLAELTQPIWSLAFASVLAYELAAVGPDGDVIAIAGGDIDDPFAVVGPTPERGEYVFDVPPTDVPAGYSLRLRMFFSGFYTSTMRMLYGGGDFADAGLTLSTGVMGMAVDGEVTGPPAPVADPVDDEAPLDLPATGASALPLAGLALALLAARRRSLR